LKNYIRNNKQRRSLLLLLVFILPLALFSQDIKQEISDALQSGDTAMAVELLAEEIRLDPSDAYNYHVLGQIYFARKKFAEAEEQFQISVNKDKKFWPGLYSLGLVQLKLDKIEEAEENFQRGLKKSKNMKADFHNGMGLVHMAKGEYREADSELRKAIIADSLKAEYHLNLGDVNFYSKVYPLAISEYETALQLDTASKEVYFHWAEACLELKDFTCALEKLNIVLQKDSTYADAWMKAGGIYYKAARSSRDPEEADKHYRATIGSYKKYFELSNEKPDSTNGRAYYEIGMSYLVLNGFADARENFATVLSIPVEPKDIYFYYARSFHGNQEFEQAIANYNKHLEWASAQEPDYVSGIREDVVYKRIGECYKNLKDHYNTIKYYTKSLEFDSTQSRLLFDVAVAYNYVGDYRNALIYYMKRINLGLDERFWSLYYNAAMSALYLAEKGGSSMVDEEDDLGLDDEPEEEAGPDPLADVDLARLAIEYLEKISIEYWDYVISNEKNHKTAVKALNMLGSTYLYQLNDCKNGVANLERVLEMDPGQCDALKSIGYAYFGGLCSTNYNKALDLLNRALECSKKSEGWEKCKDIDLLLWIAQTYQFRAIDKREAKQKEESKTDYKSAYDWYLKVLDCEPGNKAAIEGRDQVKFEF
jgi:tetratricopeptide (TPR) repeat protein